MLGIEGMRTPTTPRPSVSWTGAFGRTSRCPCCHLTDAFALPPRAYRPSP